MIVNRRTFTAKKGCVDEAVAVLKGILELFTSKFGDVTYRIYTSNIGPFDGLTLEAEYESLAEYDRLVTEFHAVSELAPLMEKWNKVTETGRFNEIWTLVE